MVVCQIELRPLLTYEDVKRVLLLLPRRLYRDRRCGEMEFSMEYQGYLLRGGYVRLSDYARSEAR